MKKSILGALLTVTTIALVAAGCSSPSSSSSKSSSSEKTTKAENKTSQKSGKWSYKDDVFKTNDFTFKLTKNEVRDSETEGKKVLVVYTTVTNDSKKPQAPEDVAYMYIHASQKTDKSEKELESGIVKLDDNGNNPLQTQADAMHDKLLPGKTVQGIMTFELVNDTPVKVNFENAIFSSIGSKTIDVK